MNGTLSYVHETAVESHADVVGVLTSGSSVSSPVTQYIAFPHGSEVGEVAAGTERLRHTVVETHLYCDGQSGCGFIKIQSFDIVGKSCDLLFFFFNKPLVNGKMLRFLPKFYVNLCIRNIFLCNSNVQSFHKIMLINQNLDVYGLQQYKANCDLV